MNVGSALVGGFVGTLVLTTVERAAGELKLTRMDLPFLLGTAFTDNRRRAKMYGYVLQFIGGLVFAVAYGAFFAAIGWSSVVLGMVLGIVQAAFNATVLITILLPIAHPRIGTVDTAAHETALIEPPGFMMLNYGRNSFLITLAAHAAYGAIVAWSIRI
jgi:hypothetical protein